MNNTILLAVSAGLAGMLGWGFADFFAKKTIDKVGDTATLAWAHFFGVILIVSLVLARSLSNGQLEGVPNNISQILMLAFFGILQAFVYFFFFRGFGKGKLSLLNPVASSYSGVVVPLSVVIFGETIGLSALVWLGLIFLGIIVISLDQDSAALRKLKITKISGMNDVLIGAILAAIWTVLWGNFVTDKDWLTYAAIMYIFMSLTILIISWVQKIKLNVINKSTAVYFFLIGLAEVVAYVGISIGYSKTPHTSIIAVLSASFAIPAVILSHVFLKERITNFQISGVVMVIFGIIMISMM